MNGFNISYRFQIPIFSYWGMVTLNWTLLCGDQIQSNKQDQWRCQALSICTVRPYSGLYDAYAMGMLMSSLRTNFNNLRPTISSLLIGFTIVLDHILMTKCKIVVCQVVNNKHTTVFHQVIDMIVKVAQSLNPLGAKFFRVNNNIPSSL